MTTIRLPGTSTYLPVISKGITGHLPIGEDGPGKIVECGYIVLGHSAKRETEAVRAFTGER